MRLVTYDRGGARRLGAWMGDIVVDLPDAVGHPAFPATLEALVARNGGTTLDAARHVLSRPDCMEEARVGRPRILAPLVPDASMRILGPEDDVPWPPEAAEIACSVEVLAVMGRGGRDLSLEEARSCVFGYTIMLHWIVRPGNRPRRNGSRAAVSPGFAVTLGPSLATADEFDPRVARAVVTVDGSTRLEAALNSGRLGFPETIAAASFREPVQPGDLYGSGRLAGTGRRTSGRTIRPGSLVEVRAPGIGVQRHRVGKP